MKSENRAGWRAPFLWVGTLAALLVTAAPLAAQGEDPALAQAQDLFAEAEAHFRARRFEAAAEAFQRSYDIMREARHPNAPMILYNIGTSLEELPGREAEARDAYVRFLAEGNPTDEVVQERSVQVQARIRALDQVLQQSSADGADSGGGEISPAGPVLLGVGGAALVAGGILFAVMLAENDAFLAMCTDDVCPTGARPAAENVQTLAIATDALVISGALIAATGLVLTLVLQGSGDTTAGAACTTDGCVAAVGGTF